MGQKSYIIILLLWAFTVPILAATKLSPNERHYVSVWGQCGYATLLNNTSTIKSGPGVSPALGVGYRFFRNGFVLQTGLEGQYSYLTSKISQADVNIDMIDTEGDPFVLNARVVKNKDVTNAVQLNIPVLLGYEYRHFYFLTGASLNFNLYSTAKSQSTIATTGTYEFAIDAFEDMPNHELRNDLKVSSPSYAVKWNFPAVNLHAEIGGRVDRFFADRSGEVSLRNYRVYVGVFAEYGILNIHSNDTKGELFSYMQEEGQALRFEQIPAMISNQMVDAKVNPLTVGIKACFVWELPKSKICILCKD